VTIYSQTNTPPYLNPPPIGTAYIPIGPDAEVWEYILGEIRDRDNNFESIDYLLGSASNFVKVKDNVLTVDGRSLDPSKKGSYRISIVLTDTKNAQQEYQILLNL